MKCKYCSKETNGITLFHPMFNPPKEYHPDICEECSNTLIDSQDWSINKFIR
jgi:hypothetical protein